MTVLRRTMFVAAGGAGGATARVLLATLLPMAIDRPHWSIAALLLVTMLPLVTCAQPARGRAAEGLRG